MGQRSQLFIVLPEKYYNENNPNNKPPRIKVYHNQWLYGVNFIKYLARLLKTIEYLNKKEDFDIEKNVNNAILHCNYADLDYITNTRIYEEDKEHNNLDLVEAKSVMDFIKYWDNNNGFMYIRIGDNGKPSYCILNGLEDADEIKIKTPKEYINLFYKDEELKDKEELLAVLEAIKTIEQFESVDVFKELTTFKKKITKLVIKKVIEEL